MKISVKSVVGGWQTLFIFADGTESLAGPVFNKTTDAWDWQRANLFNVASEYVLAKVA
jgi:hypothetical protein